MIQKQQHLYSKIKLSRLEVELLALIEHIEPGRAHVDNLGTTITVLFLEGAFPAVVRIGGAHIAADDTPALLGTEITLVTDAHGG